MSYIQERIAVAGSPHIKIITLYYQVVINYLQLLDNS